MKINRKLSKESITKAFLDRFSSERPINPLMVFLLLSVIVACSVGALGLYIYRKNGSYALDLSRPDYKDTREEIQYMPENKRAKVEKDGKVDFKFAEEVDSSFDYYLKQLGDEPFTDRSISNEALGI